MMLGLIAVFAFAASAQTDLVAMDGTHVNLQSQKGKVVVLAVGASWLPLSGKQVEYTNALAKKYAGKDVVFYFVATDSSNTRSKNYADDSAIRKFAFDNKLSGVTLLRDHDGMATLRQYHIEQVPSFVILDKNGVQSGEPFGGIDPNPKNDPTLQISRAIDKLL